MNDLLAAALGYLGMGLAPIPIKEDKSPNLTTWKPYQERPPTPEEIGDWFAVEQYGIGLVCGKVSGNLVRLDFDDPADYEELKGRLPEGTPVFKSQRPGGGYGALLKSATSVDKMPEGTFKGYPKLAVLGNGSQTVVPPTPGYEWLTQWKAIPVVDVLQWLKDSVGYEPEERRPSLAELAGLGPSAARDAEFVDLLTGTEEGGRHRALLRLGGRLRWYGLGLEFAVALLIRCARDWPYTEKKMGEGEIRRTIESVYRYGGTAPDLAERLEAEDYSPPTLAELKAKGYESGEPIAEGLLHRGDLLLMFAGAGVGKSTRVENGGAQIASGFAVFGVFPVPRPYRVMIWELENPVYEVIERMELLRKTYPFSDDFLRVDAFPGMDIADPIWQKRLAQGLASFRPDVLMIEPLAAMHHKDENSATEMRQVLNPLKEMAAEYGIAVVLCDHKGWGEEGMPHKRPRGSSVKVDIVTTAVDISDMGEFTSKFTFVKSRSIGRAPIQEVELRYDPDTHVLSLADPRELRKTEAVFMIAGLRTRGLTLQAIADAVGAHKSMISRIARGGAAPSDELLGKLKEFHETSMKHLPRPE